MTIEAQIADLLTDALLPEAAGGAGIATAYPRRPRSVAVSSSWSPALIVGARSVTDIRTNEARQVVSGKLSTDLFVVMPASASAALRPDGAGEPPSSSAGFYALEAVVRRLLPLLARRGWTPGRVVFTETAYDASEVVVAALPVTKQIAL